VRDQFETKRNMKYISRISEETLIYPPNDVLNLSVAVTTFFSLFLLLKPIFSTTHFIKKAVGRTGCRHSKDLCQVKKVP
jgi:hypothetical protein